MVDTQDLFLHLTTLYRPICKNQFCPKGERDGLITLRHVILFSSITHCFFAQFELSSERVLLIQQRANVPGLGG
jgi:hypothetical protein